MAEKTTSTSKEIREWLSSIGSFLGGLVALFGILNFEEIAKEFTSSPSMAVIEVPVDVDQTSISTDETVNLSVSLEELEVLGICDNTGFPVFEKRGEFYYQFTIDGQVVANLERANYESKRVNEKIMIKHKPYERKINKNSTEIIHLEGQVWDADDTLNFSDDLVGQVNIELRRENNWGVGDHSVTLGSGGCSVNLIYNITST